MIRIIECCMCKKMTKANLVLKDTNICTNCEKKILKASINHKDYIKYKDGIKKVFGFNYEYNP